MSSVSSDTGLFCMSEHAYMQEPNGCPESHISSLSYFLLQSHVEQQLLLEWIQMHISGDILSHQTMSYSGASRLSLLCQSSCPLQMSIRDSLRLKEGEHVAF